MLPVTLGMVVTHQSAERGRILVVGIKRLPREKRSKGRDGRASGLSSRSRGIWYQGCQADAAPSGLDPHHRSLGGGGAVVSFVKDPFRFVFATLAMLSLVPLAAATFLAAIPQPTPQQIELFKSCNELWRNGFATLMGALAGRPLSGRRSKA